MTGPSTRDSRASRANRSLRAAHSTLVAAATPRRRSLRAGPLAIFLVMVVAAACGKKGPPLAPFQRVPAAVTAVTALRMGDDVYLSFTVPATNVDGQKPSDIEKLEVYAVTATHPPETEEQRDKAELIATVPVRPILPEQPTAPDGTPLPLPPGVERGAVAVVKDTLTPEARIAVELPPKKEALVIAPAADSEPPVLALVAPAPTELPRRYYFVAGISPRGRTAVPSTPVSIPLEPGSSAPGTPQVTYTESEMTITWPPSPDARTATTEVAPPPSVPATPGATASLAGTATPAVPPPPLLLVAKSLGFNSTATTYHVFEVPIAPPSNASPALTVPAGLTPQPLAVTTLKVKGVGFGAERCFFVRPVDTVFGAVVQGPASPIGCVTPRDNFPPAAPKQLAAIASAGVINLIWEPNSEPALAGYIVLRGEAPGDKLQALTPAPIVSTSYRDSDVKPGVRYVYAVVAVDKADPPNLSEQSNRAEETARQ